jgi:hypothetical protein
MNKIFIDDNTFYYKGKLDSPIDNSSFLTKVKTILYQHPQFLLTSDSSYTPTDEPVSKTKVNPTKGQYISLVTSKFSTSETRKILAYATNFLSQTYNVPNDFVFLSWVLFADNKDERSYYHDHLDINGVRNQWSFCYYIQMPNNLIGNQGKLMFKTETGIEHATLPEEGDLIIFPGNLLHTPIEAVNSNKDRVVFCSNIAFSSLLSKKVQKSLL